MFLTFKISINQLNNWYIDFDCSNHMIFTMFSFLIYIKFVAIQKHFDYITNEFVIWIRNKCVVTFIDIFSNDSKITINIRDVFHVSNFATKLISISKLIHNNNKMIFKNDNCFVMHKIFEKIVFHVSKSKNQYWLNIIRKKFVYKVYSKTLYAIFKYNEKVIDL